MSIDKTTSLSTGMSEADKGTGGNAQADSEFQSYLEQIVQQWMKVLTLLAGVLIPLFFLLDYFTRPEYLHTRFALYRGIATLIVLGEYALLRVRRPGRFYPLHGYFISFVISMMIVLMTVDLGGFDSSYYAGLSLVVIAVNMLLSWHSIHSLINGGMVMGLYLVCNALSMQPFDPLILANNLYFLGSTVIITVAISWVRFKLVRSEHQLRSQLVGANQELAQSRGQVLRARDALWGEMQLAKMIQTALLPQTSQIGAYEVASLMLPADVVGGDYYDIIETPLGEKWVGIGDVSGHGVDSGLIMMMAQTAIQTIVKQRAGHRPSEILHWANGVLKENIARLGTDQYMSIVLFRLESDHILAAGKHTDLIVYRARERRAELISTNGSWLGITDDLGPSLQDHRIPIFPGDILLLYTDGVTEARNGEDEVYGEDRLLRLFEANAHLPLWKLGNTIFSAVTQFSSVQTDDITFLLLRNRTRDVGSEKRELVTSRYGSE